LGKVALSKASELFIMAFWTLYVEAQLSRLGLLFSPDVIAASLPGTLEDVCLGIYELVTGTAGTWTLSYLDTSFG